MFRLAKAAARRQTRPKKKKLESQVERIAYRKTEAAEMLGLCLRTIDNMIAAKELTARKFGRVVIIPAAAIYGLMFCPVPRNSVTRVAYSKREAAFALGLSVRTIDNLIAAGELKSHKLRGRVLIPVTSLYALIRCDHKTKRRAG
jgi:excisionase family DNA binding protein